MPSWYDYIPAVGTAVEAYKGNGKQAAIDAGGPLVVGGEAMHGAAQEQKQGYYTAADQARALADKQRALQMQGLGQAEGYFAGARERLNKMYGDPMAQAAMPPDAVGPSAGPAMEARQGRGHF